MTLDEQGLQSIMCMPGKFQEYFLLPEGTNITEILNVLCSLNFTQFAEELEENFMVNAMTRKVTNIMTLLLLLHFQ